MSLLAKYFDILARAGAGHIRLVSGELPAFFSEGRPPEHGKRKLTVNDILGVAAEIFGPEAMKDLASHGLCSTTHEQAGATFVLDLARAGADVALSIRLAKPGVAQDRAPVEKASEGAADPQAGPKRRRSTRPARKDAGAQAAVRTPPAREGTDDAEHGWEPDGEVAAPSEGAAAPGLLGLFQAAGLPTTFT